MSSQPAGAPSGSVLLRVSQAEETGLRGYAREVQVYGPLTTLYAGPRLPVNTAMLPSGTSPTQDDLRQVSRFLGERGLRPTVQAYSDLPSDTNSD